MVSFGFIWFLWFVGLKHVDTQIYCGLKMFKTQTKIPGSDAEMIAWGIDSSADYISMIPMTV